MPCLTGRSALAFRLGKTILLHCRVRFDEEKANDLRTVTCHIDLILHGLTQKSGLMKKPVVIRTGNRSDRRCDCRVETIGIKSRRDDG